MNSHRFHDGTDPTADKDVFGPLVHNAYSTMQAKVATKISDPRE